MHVAGKVGMQARTRGWLNPSRHAMSGVLMSGGKLFVPPTEYDDFLSAYAADIAAGVRHYVVERATPRVKWYADIDLVRSGALSDAELMSIASATARALAKAEPPGSAVILLVAGPKLLGDGRVKTGIHMVAPQLQCTLPRAAALRDQLLPALERECGDCLNGWDEALDRSVYAAGSLRLVGSRKMEPCDAGGACHASGGSCERCGGTRRVDAGRAYAVAAAVDAGGVRSDEWERALRSNYPLAVRKCSIRVPSSQSGVAAALPGVAAAARPPAKRARGGTGGEVRLASLLHAPHTSLDPQHRELEVRVSSTSGGGGAFLLALGPGARYCTNVGRCHRSSCVWFQLRDGMLTQRCFCKKGTCPRFRGPSMRLSGRGLQFMGCASADSGLPAAFMASSVFQRA